MILTIIVIVFSLVLLMVLHELGHFAFAKLFGVKVEEFGIGYPPRIFGKKIGQTIYSLNILPFGAFVKMPGEEKREASEGSFSQKPIWQRALIIFGGVLTFWIIAFLILTFLSASTGVPASVSDEFKTTQAMVQIIDIAVDTPAEISGLKAGDVILSITAENNDVLEAVDKLTQVQAFTQQHLGENLLITIQRGKQTMALSIIPRTEYGEDEGPMGVALARVVSLDTAWYKAPLMGFDITVKQTKAITTLLYRAIASIFTDEQAVGVKLTGPIGIGQMMNQALSTGAGNFLMLLAMISLWLAIANLLPIPALDGGKLLFIAIEGIKGKPVSEKVELKITSVFFILLLALMAFVTLRDIIGLF